LHAHLFDFNLLYGHGRVSGDVIPSSALCLKISKLFDVSLEHGVKLDIVVFADTIFNQLFMLDEQVNGGLQGSSESIQSLKLLKFKLLSVLTSSEFSFKSA
jgi:hypothetical protein